MFNRFSFQNFKSWERADISMGKLTGFFGANSSGKTSIFQLLLLLKQTIESSDRGVVLEFGDSRTYVELGTFRDIIHLHESSDRSMDFEIEWKLPKQLTIKNPQAIGDILFKGDKITFGCKIQENGSRNLFVSAFHYVFGGQRFLNERKNENSYSITTQPDKSSATLILSEEIQRQVNPDRRGIPQPFRFIRAKGRGWDLPKPFKFYGFPDAIKFYYQNASFLSDFQLALENAFANIYYIGPLREYPQRQYSWAGSQPNDMGRRGEQVVDALLVSKQRDYKIRISPRKTVSMEEYIASWLSKLGLIASFRVSPIVEGSNLYQVLVKKTAHSPEVLITDVGFGVSQILPVITLCFYAPSGSVLLIEQPEIHLHPSVQAGLADVFLDAIEKNKVQIIVESHSEHFIRRLQRRVAEEKISQNDISLYFCQATDSGSNLTALEVDTYGDILNWPEGFFGNDVQEIIETRRAIRERKMQPTNGNQHH